MCGCQLGWGSLAPVRGGGTHPGFPVALEPQSWAHVQWEAGCEQLSVGVPDCPTPSLGRGPSRKQGWRVGWWWLLRCLGLNPPEKVKFVPSLSLPIAKKRKSDKVRGPGGVLGCC